jgi:hypothetical protein
MHNRNYESLCRFRTDIHYAPAFLLYPVAQGRNGARFATALEYNNYIIERQSGVIYHIMDLTKMADVDLQTTELLINRGVVLTDSVLADVRGLSDFKGDSTLRNSAIDMFTFYRKVFDNDYREIVAIRKKGDALTGDDYQRLLLLQQGLEQEESEKDKHFHNAQQDFATRNHLRLGNNALQKQIDGKE